MKRLIVATLYFLGDITSKIMVRYDWAFLYSPYNWFMTMSGDLDDIWEIGYWENNEKL